MVRSVKSNNRGLTLVEVMIALLVALVIFLALMQTALIGIDANMRNVLRDEAVSVAAEKMDLERDMAFSSVVSETPPTVYRQVRNVNVPFYPNITIWDLDANNKMINVRVTWQWKGDNYSHSISTIRKGS
jgi:prepilin-type N-terminal cleavage/methylation domain-containing protein